LINDDGMYKITDFGVSMKLKSSIRATIKVGEKKAKGYSPSYAAPEVLRRGIISPKSDIFSLGVIIFEMCQKNLPWNGMGGNAINESTLPLELSEYFSKDLKDIMQKCTSYFEKDRPSASELIEMLERIKKNQITPNPPEPDPDPIYKPHPVSFNLSYFFSCLAFAIGFTIWAGYLFENDHPIWGLIVSFFSLAGYLMLKDSWKGQCPYCEKITGSLNRSDSIQNCEKCKKAIFYADKSISVVPADYSSKEPVFKLSLPNELTWPNKCCACGKKATRFVEVSKKKSAAGRNVATAVLTGGMVIRTGGGKQMFIKVPHCDSHTDGAEISDEKELKVRSYSFFQEFEKMNPQHAE
jgi:serine/threonine protein kinase